VYCVYLPYYIPIYNVIHYLSAPFQRLHAVPDTATIPAQHEQKCIHSSLIKKIMNAISCFAIMRSKTDVCYWGFVVQKETHWQEGEEGGISMFSGPICKELINCCIPNCSAQVLCVLSGDTASWSLGLNFLLCLHSCLVEVWLRACSLGMMECIMSHSCLLEKKKGLTLCTCVMYAAHVCVCEDSLLLLSLKSHCFFTLETIRIIMESQGCYSGQCCHNLWCTCNSCCVPS